MLDSTHPKGVELSELRPTNEAESGNGPGVGLFRKVEVTVDALAGRIQTSVGAMMDLSEGSVLKLDTLMDAPILIVLNGQTFARGELVVVDEHLGVRVTEVAPLDL